MAITENLYRIGVDVGGTNTDAVLACIRKDEHGHFTDTSIIAKHKASTSSDVTTGICEAIQSILVNTNIARRNVISVNIGTTHFINAVVQADSEKLNRVAVLRLCGPFCREVEPFLGFPPQLRAVVEGYVGYLSGGLEIDGRIIQDVVREEVVEHMRKIYGLGIRSVVVIGVFSPLDVADLSQEDEVKAIIQDNFDDVDVVCSRDIGRIGFLERENACILNASILEIGRKSISSFETALEALDLNCQLYLTQNDGTVMTTEMARLTPIKTFSSGATNSLIGAIYLSGIHKKDSKVDLKRSQLIMVDIGGTTSDFAALSASGFPRQSAATVTIAGVRTAFNMPEVYSIGLGGGSRVTISHEDSTSKPSVSVGPTSVGYKLNTESRCFGGSTLTATDIVVASGFSDSITPVWTEDLDPETMQLARQNITRKLQRGVDMMKSSDLDVVLLLVGGGSIIQMDELEGVKTCIRPEYYDVANAVGAAIANVSGEIDIIEVPNGRSQETIEHSLKAKAVEMAVRNGAQEGTVKIVEVEAIPVLYVTNHAIRVIIKAIGEPSFRRDPLHKRMLNECNGFRPVRPKRITKLLNVAHHTVDPLDIDREKYIPNVSKATGEWFLSEVDLAFIREGCGVLGTGGGGSVYSVFMNSVQTLRMVGPSKMRIIKPQAVYDASDIATVAYIGAPSVSNERLVGASDMCDAVEGLAQFRGTSKPAGIIVGEIGGGAGLRAFTVAGMMDIPIVDADTMGRAFPRLDLSLPAVYDAMPLAPVVLSDARKNVVILADVQDNHRLETLARSICAELGMWTAFAHNLTGSVLKDYCTHNIISETWYIGRAMHIAWQKKTNAVEAIISAVPGARLLYAGKIGPMERKVQKGWTIGTAVVLPDADSTIRDTCEAFEERPLALSYMNEFLHAAYVNPNTSIETVCTTPDLISVLDQDGSALATNELRFGLRVSVIAMPAHPLWMTEKGMAAVSPAALGVENVEYKPYGTEWVSPKSVIDEFAR